ncbi:VOC family protein [Algibacter mikhailovii]|uniref:VOC family protein n=1 Tax=Algibacter mikhailovii TaxID=425498 RepID=UPI00249423BC|nr:VOC family protein [Algibacter mikhailovii]
MEQRLTMVTLGVNDLAIASIFYEDKFGWKKMKSSNEGVIFFRLNGILLSLYPKAKLAQDAMVSSDGYGFKGFTLAFNTRSKKEVDDLITRFEAKGVTIVKKPEDVFWGGYSGYIADPDENLWEIAFNPFLPLDADGNVQEE